MAAIDALLVATKAKAGTTGLTAAINRARIQIGFSTPAESKTVVLPPSVKKLSPEEQAKKRLADLGVPVEDSDRVLSLGDAVSRAESVKGVMGALTALLRLTAGFPTLKAEIAELRTAILFRSDSKRRPLPQVVAVVIDALLVATKAKAATSRT